MNKENEEHATTSVAGQRWKIEKMGDMGGGWQRRKKSAGGQEQQRKSGRML